jgi:DNA-binding NtrC family response regulator
VKPEILLTFNGDRDPFAPSGQDGPILSLLAQEALKTRFRAVMVFCTTDKVPQATTTIEAIQARHGLPVRLQATGIDDPTDYERILSELRRLFTAILLENPDCDFAIFLSPGTPQMQACWWHLAQSGEIPARRMLALRPKQYLAHGQAPLTEYLVRLVPRQLPKLELQGLPAVGDDEMEAVLTRVGMVGRHPLLKRVLQTAKRAAATDEPILILGESGTGKEFLARFIHDVSPRKARPLITMNCGAISETLAESYLFGHCKGAFTDAKFDKQGVFETAHGTSLFMDEIGELSLASQAKLLRTLQNGEIQPVGETTPRKVDARVVAATNVNLEEAVREKRFRGDLYHRLNVVPLALPPLRERITDIPLLVAHFIGLYNEKYGHDYAFDEEALRVFMQYTWPGNIRELHQAVKRCCIHAEAGVIDAAAACQHLGRAQAPNPLTLPPLPYEGFQVTEALDRVRQYYYEKAVELSSGNIQQAAKLVGVSQQNLNQYLKRRKNNPS